MFIYPVLKYSYALMDIYIDAKDIAWLLRGEVKAFDLLQANCKVGLATSQEIEP